MRKFPRVQADNRTLLLRRERARMRKRGDVVWKNHFQTKNASQKSTESFLEKNHKQNTNYSVMVHSAGFFGFFSRFGHL